MIRWLVAAFAGVFPKMAPTRSEFRYQRRHRRLDGDRFMEAHEGAFLMLDILSTVHARDDDLELYVRGRLEQEHISTVESHLLECQTCRERLSQCIGLQLILHVTGKTKSEEKYERSEPRFSTGDDAIFQELSPLSLDRHKVKIVDISKN